MTLCYVHGKQCNCQPDEGVECTALPAQAQEEMASLRRDAERYRWMRSEGLGFIRWEGFTTETCDVGLDGAIDAAINDG